MFVMLYNIKRICYVNSLTATTDHCAWEYKLRDPVSRSQCWCVIPWSSCSGGDRRYVVVHHVYLRGTFVASVNQHICASCYTAKEEAKWNLYDITCNWLWSYHCDLRDVLMCIVKNKLAMVYACFIIQWCIWVITTLHIILILIKLNFKNKLRAA